MSITPIRAPKGLANVVIAETTISDVRPEGKLIFRGHTIQELVKQPFEEVAALVVGCDAVKLNEALRSAANLTAAETAQVLSLPRTLHPMRMLQGMVPLLEDVAIGDESDQYLGPEFSEVNQGVHVAAKLPAVVATHLMGQAVVMDQSATYIERFLKAIGTELTAANLHACNVTQILQLEHSLNAGTFAARVVASTKAGVASAMAAGLGALSGPLHGGADQAALEIVDALEPDQVKAYVDEILSTGGRVPGMGHREYRVRDPRALYLEEIADSLSMGTEHRKAFEKLRLLDTTFRAEMDKRGKEVHANVEFYKGLVYRMLGLPNEFFTAGFAMARVFGYLAHFVENSEDNKIYRPQAMYVGA